MRAFATRAAVLCATIVFAACSSDMATGGTGGSSGSSNFALTRVAGDTLPALDSGDSVATTTGVEYREIYLERGSLSLTHDAQPRFETLLHYAWYAVTQTSSGPRLDLRSVLDIRDRGTVTADAQGNLLLTSDLDSTAVHVASAVAGGYNVQYRFSSIVAPLALFFRPDGAP